MALRVPSAKLLSILVPTQQSILAHANFKQGSTPTQFNGRTQMLECFVQSASECSAPCQIEISGVNFTKHFSMCSGALPNRGFSKEIYIKTLHHWKHLFHSWIIQDPILLLLKSVEFCHQFKSAGLSPW